MLNVRCSRLWQTTITPLPSTICRFPLQVRQAHHRDWTTPSFCANLLPTWARPRGPPCEAEAVSERRKPAEKETNGENNGQKAGPRNQFGGRNRVETRLWGRSAAKAQNHPPTDKNQTKS